MLYLDFKMRESRLYNLDNILIDLLPYLDHKDIIISTYSLTLKNRLLDRRAIIEEEDRIINFFKSNFRDIEVDFLFKIIEDYEISMSINIAHEKEESVLNAIILTQSIWSLKGINSQIPYELMKYLNFFENNYYRNNSYRKIQWILLHVECKIIIREI